jgi:hypothetical protein
MTWPERALFAFTSLNFACASSSVAPSGPATVIFSPFGPVNVKSGISAPHLHGPAVAKV